MCPQVIPEEDVLKKRFGIKREDMQMPGAWSRAKKFSARYARLATVFVTEFSQRLTAFFGKWKRMHDRRNVQNRFGMNARNCGAADVFDPLEHTASRE